MLEMVKQKDREFDIKYQTKTEELTIRENMIKETHAKNTNLLTEKQNAFDMAITNGKKHMTQVELMIQTSYNTKIKHLNELKSEILKLWNSINSKETDESEKTYISEFYNKYENLKIIDENDTLINGINELKSHEQNIKALYNKCSGDFDFNIQVDTSELQIDDIDEITIKQYQ